MTARSLAERLAVLSPDLARCYIDGLADTVVAGLAHHWRFWARPEQLAPPGDWRIWLIMAGRGFGKTRAGAEWVRSIGETQPDARIALVAANLAEARSIMVEGQSGLLAIAPDASRPLWEPSLRRLRWPGGAQATLFSAAEPESLRGPEHSHAWCDEIAKWDNASGRAMAAWDNLQLGLRVGALPQVAATTTPRAVPLVRHLLAASGLVISRGSSHANRGNLPHAFLDAVEGHYGGTALGRQELDGELLEDVEGALWNRSLIEACRVRWSAGTFVRVVIGVDPPAGSSGDACGIIVCALLEDGRAAVLADASIEGASPERWARAVAQASDSWKADRIIAEANQGGEMVGAVLRASDIALPVRLVHASRGKVARAEPVAALYEAGRVLHCGTFARLEDELCGLMTGGGYLGPGRSPDRADALVWAFTELMLGRRGTPRIRSLEN
jgi:phage terminase large subunit-like protein